MRRIKVTVAYDGTEFHGWQVQPGLPTIQGELERILAEIEGAAVQVAGSGRTDAGVHALGQVAAFDLNNPIPAENLRRALNRLLPPTIRINQAELTHPEFHPRYHAAAKTYEYRIWRPEVCPPFECRYVHHYPYPLDVGSMMRCAPLLEGEHDFSAFAASDERDAEGRSKRRTIFSSMLMEDGERLLYLIRGSGFLKHMVRNIVGTLIEAGRGNLDRERLLEMLEPGFPGKSGSRAPASGLFLVSVEYGTPGREASSGQSGAPEDA